jgi:ribosome recycling factor
MGEHKQMIRPIIESAQPKMDKAIDHLVEELKSIRTGRASGALVENLAIDYYGMTQPLKAIASINTPDARTIAITPWDKGAMTSIEKAIQDSPTLGLNPMNDGVVIRLSIPTLTEERRREIAKSLGSKIEDCRIALRNIRHDVLKEVQKLEKDKLATQDDVKFAESELNKKIDACQLRIDEIEAAKTKEILEV